MSSRHSHGAQATRAFRPQCTHLTMTRVYDPSLTCQTCHYRGQFGWLYRCTQDRDGIIEQTAPTFDEIGEFFWDRMVPRRGSPEARADKYSFFDELSVEQMASYKPYQLKIILKQRENLKEAIARDQFRKSGSAPVRNLRPPLDLDAFAHSSIYAGRWSITEDDECQYIICSRCRPACMDRAFLSLDSVADGEIPPTAAVGYGFQGLGGRPIVNACLLKRVGLRSPPRRPIKSSGFAGSWVSQQRMMEMLEEQIGRIRPHPQSPSDLQETPPLATRQRSLRRSPSVDNLAALREQIEHALSMSVQAEESSTSTSSDENSFERRGLDHDEENGHTNGDKPCSIALRRHRLYRQVFGGSLPDLPAPAHVQSLGAVQSGQNEATPGQEQRNVKEQDPLSTLYQFEDWEEKSLRNTFCSQSTGHDHDHSDGHFAPAPLRVDHGVALTEESLELKVPDVITQL